MNPTPSSGPDDPEPEENPPEDAPSPIGSRVLGGALSPLGRGIASPERACLGCVLAVGALLLCAAVWIYLYWRLNPEFHAPSR